VIRIWQRNIYSDLKPSIRNNNVCQIMTDKNLPNIEGWMDQYDAYQESDLSPNFPPLVWRIHRFVFGLYPTKRIDMRSGTLSGNNCFSFDNSTTEGDIAIQNSKL
jgi:hypothetical protein